MSKQKSSPAKSIQQWLESPNAHSTIKHAHQLLALEQDWQQAAANAVSTRPLSGAAPHKLPTVHSHIATMNNGELVVLVQSAATRAKLQLNSPELLTSLQAKGWQINAIRYQVQATNSAPAAQPARAGRVLTATDATHLAQSSTQVHHPGLGQALRRLASRAKRA
jgi:hypothetical protein